MRGESLNFFLFVGKNFLYKGSDIFRRIRVTSIFGMINHIDERKKKTAYMGMHISVCQYTFVHTRRPSFYFS